MLQTLTNPNLLEEILDILEKYRNGSIPINTEVIDDVLRRLQYAILLEYMPMVLCYQKHEKGVNPQWNYVEMEGSKINKTHKMDDIYSRPENK